MFSDAMDQPGNQQLVHELPKEVADWRQRWRDLYHPAPRGLFHYTDAAGLEGIIKSGCLWATHIYCLNDSQEFRYAGQLINKTLKNQIESHNHPDERRWILECYRNHSVIWEGIGDPYVTCFCAKGELLSQWRAYAANGSGFAIEFEPIRLLDSFKNDRDIAVNTKLIKVIYDEEEQTRLIEEAIEQLLKAFSVHQKQEVLDCVPLVFSEMSFCFKHPAFTEEQEWRLVFTPRAERLLNVRVSRGQILPYASLPFCTDIEQPPYVGVVHRHAGIIDGTTETKKGPPLQVRGARNYLSAPRCRDRPKALIPQPSLPG